MIPSCIILFAKRDIALRFVMRAKIRKNPVLVKAPPAQIHPGKIFSTAADVPKNGTSTSELAFFAADGPNNGTSTARNIFCSEEIICYFCFLRLIFCLMKKILLILSLAFVCAGVQAQTYEESMRPWSDGPLTWEELTLKSSNSFKTSDLSFNWAINHETEHPYWNTLRLVRKPLVALDKSTSWHNIDKVYDYTLAYDQAIFDLNELYFRKMLNDLYSKDNKQSEDVLYSFYFNQFRVKCQEMEEETDDGMDSLAVIRRSSAIKKELAAVSYPDINEYNSLSWGLCCDMTMGVTNNMFFGELSDTFTPAIGINFGLTLGYKKHLLSTVMNSGWSTLGQDYSHNGLVWAKGDRYGHTYIGGSYGYMAYDGAFFSVIPRIGVARRDLSWTYESGNDELTDAVSTTVILAGAEFRFKFFRLVSWEVQQEHSLALRAFIARDFEQLNATSLNLSLSYCWSTR